VVRNHERAGYLCAPAATERNVDASFTEHAIYDHYIEAILGCDIFLAEVSYPSTGLGIELQVAANTGVPIVLIHAVHDGCPPFSKMISGLNTKMFEITTKTREIAVDELAKLISKIETSKFELARAQIPGSRRADVSYCGQII
jgi:hypothetical protein